MCTVLNFSDLHVPTRSGVGNYFRPRATWLFYQCLAGHISVKKAKSKLKILALPGRMWPAGRMLPPPALGPKDPPVKNLCSTKAVTLFIDDSCGQFHQRSTYSFYARSSQV